MADWLSRYRGQCDASARAAIGTTSARCRLFLESEMARKVVFSFYVLDRRPDEAPMLIGEHLLDYGKKWRG